MSRLGPKTVVQFATLVCEVPVCRFSARIPSSLYSLVSFPSHVCLLLPDRRSQHLVVPSGLTPAVEEQDSDAMRTTILAGPEAERYVWCVEEYKNGIRVSQWKYPLMKVATTTWLEGISLLDELAAPYLEDHTIKGVVTYHDTLLILGIDQRKKLKLLQVR